MGFKRFDRDGRQIVIHTEGAVCADKESLVAGEMFEQVVGLYCDDLAAQKSPLLSPFPVPGAAAGTNGVSASRWGRVVQVLRGISVMPLDTVANSIAGGERLIEPTERRRLAAFVEGLYDYWRAFDRFMVLHSSPGPNSFDRRPYRAFNHTIEALANVVRAAYRDAAENVTGDHPRVYRHVAAGCDVGLIAVTGPCTLPPRYCALLSAIPFIRQVWIAPPMITNPPMNKRSGEFRKVADNPIQGLAIDPAEWLCYPAQVGPLVVLVYFHRRFIGLGCSMANLFEIARDEQLSHGPDAVYLYGVPPESLARFGPQPTVFHDDEDAGLLVGAVPGEDAYGYFGYLKKMTLTLHNAVMMKRGRMPYHGAMARIGLREGQSANVLMIGDTGTGKSETLEAFRTLGGNAITSLRIVADDMGSLEVRPDGDLRAYGTEIGAFVRLDDLKQGYAFQQLDRAIFMSPHKTNARVVVPVTTLDEVLEGAPVDFLLYANNFEAVDRDHPVIERFASASGAIEVFRAGAAMSKGTTTASGLVHSYYANIFGPPEYVDVHDRLAEAVFAVAFARGAYVGQMRTRLGIPGFETTGPEAVAMRLLELIRERGAVRG
jgi:hypothetical protein